MSGLSNARSGFAFVQCTVSEDEIRLTCPLWEQARVHTNPSTGMVATWRRMMAEKGREYRQRLGDGRVSAQFRVSLDNLRTLTYEDMEKPTDKEVEAATI